MTFSAPHRPEPKPSFASAAFGNHQRPRRCTPQRPRTSHLSGFFCPFTDPSWPLQTPLQTPLLSGFYRPLSRPSPFYRPSWRQWIEARQVGGGLLKPANNGVGNSSVERGAQRQAFRYLRVRSMTSQHARHSFFFVDSAFVSIHCLPQEPPKAAD